MNYFIKFDEAIFIILKKSCMFDVSKRNLKQLKYIYL